MILPQQIRDKYSYFKQGKEIKNCKTMKDKKYMLLLYFKKRPRILKPSHNILTPTPPIQSLKTKKNEFSGKWSKIGIKIKNPQSCQHVNMFQIFTRESCEA